MKSYCENTNKPATLDSAIDPIILEYDKTEQFHVKKIKYNQMLAIFEMFFLYNWQKCLNKLSLIKSYSMSFPS